MWSLATCVLASIMMSFVVAYKVPGRNVSIDDSYQVPKLTIDNYARMTENKTVFIRFFYTWVRYNHHIVATANYSFPTLP
jgi:hypothetical protein